MIARVIPVLRLPRGLDFFDYQVPDGLDLKPGQAVIVPFRGRNTLGVVESLERTSKLPSGRLKPVTRVLAEAPLLPPPMIRLARFVATSGYASLATTVRSMLPKMKLQEKLELSEFMPTRPAKTAPVRLITYRYESAKLEYVRDLLESAKSSGQSAIIIVPTADEAERLHVKFPALIRFDRALSDVLFRRTFLQIRNSESACIVGTRSCVFAPANRLGTITILDEDADELIQDEPNPRYDTRAVAVASASLNAARVDLVSRLPTLTSWQAYGPATELEPLPVPTTEFIDLETVRQGRDFGVIADEELSALRKVAESGNAPAVIHAHAASFGSLECQDCDFLVLCPTCAIPLRVASDQLSCRHCGHTEPVPSRCPRCRGVRLKGRGRGLEFVTRELEQSGIRVAASDKGPANAARVILPHAASQLPDRSFRRIVITRYDSLLAVPRHDADERARRLIHILAAKLDPEGVLVLQGSPHFRHAVQDAFRPDWRKEQLRTAEQYGFPPAWRLFQLRHRGPDERREVDQVLSRLRALQPKLNVTGPIQARPQSRTNQGGSLILIRTRREPLPALEAILSQLSERWTITLDPRETA